MSGRNLVVLGLGSMLVASLLAAPARASTPVVTNGDFEANSAATPFGVSTYIQGWTTYGDVPFDTTPTTVPPSPPNPQSSGTGIFPNTNPDNSVNFADDDGGKGQIAYIFSRSNVATTGNRDGMEQILTGGTFVAGTSYSVSVDVGLASQTPDSTDPFTIAIFAEDPSNPTSVGNRTIIASKTISNTANSGLSKTELMTIATDPIDGSVAAGKEIGVAIFTALGSDTNVTAGREYDFDNVSISVTPEPSSAAMMGLFGIGAMNVLGSRRRRDA